MNQTNQQSYHVVERTAQTTTTVSQIDKLINKLTINELQKSLHCFCTLYTSFTRQEEQTYVNANYRL